METRARTTALMAAAIAGLLAGALRRRAAPIDLRGRVVFITGGSRGLGLALAREFGSQGAAVALCARNTEQIEGAAAELRDRGIEALAVTCDVTDRGEIERALNEIVDRFGRLDVVVNNAGTIVVGPIAAQTRKDFEEALAIMFWGVYDTTMAALEHLRASDAPRVVTIGSIGGKISVPHLLSYSVAKFAAVAFSEGLRTELAPEGVRVTTVVPGLMRTGSHRNVVVEGRGGAEYAWFGRAASLPFTTTTAEHAARRIVAATRRGDAEAILTWQAHLAVRLQGLAPGLVTRMSGLVSRMLPDAPEGPEARRRQLAKDTPTELGPEAMLGERAAERHREP